MPNQNKQDQDNKSINDNPSGSTSGSVTAASGAGMQVSGEEIFLPEDNRPKVTKESDVFGQQKAGDTQSAGGNQPGQPSAQSDEAAKEASKQVGQVLSGDLKPVTDALNQAKDTAGAVASKVKDTAGAVASKVYEQAQDKAGSVISEQQKSLAEGLGSVAENIRKFGEALNNEQSNPIGAKAANYGNALAEQVESLSHYVESGDFRRFAGDLQSFARRNPTVFVAGAFGLGLIAARFFKSSPRSISSSGNTVGGNRGKRGNNQSARPKSTGKSANTESDINPTDATTSPTI